MLKGRKEVKKRASNKLKNVVKGGLAMSRKILAGLVVLAFVLVGSSALADCDSPLSYEIVASEATNTAQVKLFLANDDGMAAASIPLSFATVGSDIELTQISFEGSRVAHFSGRYPNIDNDKKKVLIGLFRALDENISDVLPAGEGLIATLTFKSKKSACVPELKMTNWSLSAGELCFDLVDEKGSSNCKINAKDGDITIPNRSGSGTLQDTKPAQFELKGNYPNPFNPETVIKFNLPQESAVTLRIYNVLGQVVNTVVDEVLPTGSYSVKWDGKNDQGSDVASGVYFYRIKAGTFESTQKMTLLR
jgi:hypothetical protein